jgi:hypothetical protein
MTLPIERKNAVKNVERFLLDLSNPRITPRIPKDIRDRARGLLRHYPTDLQVYRSLGIEPTEKKFIIVKSMTHFHASHEPITKEIIYLDTPGLTSARFAGFDFEKLRRPIFPLDLEMLGLTELKTMDE